MPEATAAPARRNWALTVFAAVAASAAFGFAFLYVVRPSAGELGAIKVVVTDDDGKAAGNRVTITVAEAPVTLTNTVAPGSQFTGQVNFEQPFRVPPHMKLTPKGKRLYDVAAVTEYGFGWVARPLPEDIRDDAKKDAEVMERFLGVGGFLFAQVQGKLKPGLVFEDFSWEARGLRMPTAAIAAKPYEQKGSFYSIIGQEGPVSFPLPYAGPPHIELSGYTNSTVITEVTATGFKWRNPMKEAFGNQGNVQWTARGVLAAPK